jgi:hypothetical protein
MNKGISLEVVLEAFSAYLAEKKNVKTNYTFNKRINRRQVKYALLLWIEKLL